jgi:hypothetical protein
MPSMKKATAAAVLGLMLAGAAGMAVAQQAAAPEGARHRGQPPSPEVIQRMIDGRLAGVKTALKLTPEQEKLWPAVENVIRENAAERMRYRQQMREAREQKQARPDLVERLDRMSARMEARAAAVKRLSAALKPLYPTLSDDQKQVLRFAIADAMRGQRGYGGWHHRRG